MVLLHIFGILPFTEFNMSHHDQRWTSDKNQLQSPEANVGDGEDVVIADVGAAGLEKQKTFKMVKQE